MKTRDEVIADAEEALRCIGKLEDMPEFKGFYLGLIRRRRDAYDRDVLRGEFDHIEREIRRRLGRELDEVLKLHEQEAAMAKRDLSECRRRATCLESTRIRRGRAD